MMKGAMGPKDYGILLTDRRIFFVLEKASKTALLGAIGDALLTDKKVVDYPSEDLEKLASDSKNIVVHHHDIESIRMKKGFSSYTMGSAFTLLIEHTNMGGKKKSVKAFLVPPEELVGEKSKGGLKRKQIAAEYATSIKRAFETALPPTVMHKGEWEV
ncbi:MAG: hypothetical protein MUO87_00640 [Thermoplasmata archaeon]|nr:hypothetical protein [Thermoplasmata archaeon]